MVERDVRGEEGHAKNSYVPFLSKDIRVEGHFRSLEFVT